MTREVSRWVLLSNFLLLAMLQINASPHDHWSLVLSIGWLICAACEAYCIAAFYWKRHKTSS